jgi:hypothetical protein
MGELVSWLVGLSFIYLDMYVFLLKVFAAVKIRVLVTASADIFRRLFHTNHASARYILIKTLYLRCSNLIAYSSDSVTTVEFIGSKRIQKLTAVCFTMSGTG